MGRRGEAKRIRDHNINTVAIMFEVREGGGGAGKGERMEVREAERDENKDGDDDRLKEKDKREKNGKGEGMNKLGKWVREGQGRDRVCRCYNLLVAKGWQETLHCTRLHCP